MKKGKLMITPARKWRELREDGFTALLPSGNTARLRPVSVAEMVKNGRIPDTLTPVAAEVLANGAPSTETIMRITNEVTDFMQLVTVASFIEPRVVLLKTPEETPPDDAISIWDVSLEDQAYVLQLTGAPTRALISFRNKQEGDVEPESSGEGDKDEAE
jgi:hypothetical protein